MDIIGTNMITLDQQREIKNFDKEGKSASKIAALVGITVPTVYRWLRIGEHETKDKPHWEKSSLALFLELINKEICRRKNLKKLYEELRQSGCSCSYSTLRRYVLERKAASEYKPMKRIETSAGEQAQVDWATCGKVTLNGRKRQLYCFVYTLSYSRMMYMEFTVRQDRQTFEDCHVAAFRSLGIPKTILYDNLKSVVLGRDKDTGKPEYNPSFFLFSIDYGFAINLCKRHNPQSKGKVERNIRYIRQNFFDGLKINRANFSPELLEDLNEKARTWLDNLANVRIQETTKQKPLDLWCKERKHLTSFEDIRPYNHSKFLIKNSSQNGFVSYNLNLYEVPKLFARKKLYFQEVNRRGIRGVEISFRNNIIAKHALAIGRGQIARLPGTPNKLSASPVSNQKANIQSLYKKVYRTRRSLREYNVYFSKGSQFS